MPTLTSATDVCAFILAAREQASSQGKLAERPYLVAIDGRSGSGKTCLAGRVGDLLGAAGVPVELFHLEDLYQGWEGLATAVDTWQNLTLSLFEQRGSRPAPVWWGWDWQAGQATGPHTFGPALAPAGSLVIAEGVGALCGLHDLGVFLEVDAVTRQHRALARDGETYRPYWSLWAQQEEALYATHQQVYSSATVIYRQVY